MELDTDKIDDATLALLWLNRHETGMAWKTFSWAATDRLHGKGLISDPVGKAKSIGLSEEAERRGERLARELFAKDSAT